MNFASMTLSRRSFLFSTAAAISLHALRPADSLRRVSIVGFGRHARRFLASAPASQLSVDAVFDPNPAALDLASTIMKQRQSFAPELIQTVGPSSLRRTASPVLLSSPADTWRTLLAELGSQGRPVLAHHGSVFAPGPLIERIFDSAALSANVLLVGLDPAFPLRLLQSFHDSARARGAADSRFMVKHSGWREEELLALHFDFLNASVPAGFTRGEIASMTQYVPMPSLAHQQTTPVSAQCSISVASPGITFEASVTIEINSDDSVPPECLSRFSDFCSLPDRERRGILARQAELLRHVAESREQVTLFG